MVYLFLGDVLSHCDDSSDPTGDVTGVRVGCTHSL